MSKAVAIGERGLILGFKGAGLELVPVDSAEAAARELMLLARDPDVGLVLVTETMAAEAAAAVRSFREHSTAILTTIPTHEGSEHSSLKEMRKAIEKSIGVDLLGKA